MHVAGWFDGDGAHRIRLDDEDLPAPIDAPVHAAGGQDLEVVEAEEPPALLGDDGEE